jgi:hypothetical protein
MLECPMATGFPSFLHYLDEFLHSLLWWSLASSRRVASVVRGQVEWRKMQRLSLLWCSLAQ